MTSLPEELRAFPHTLLKKLRDGTLSSPQDRQKLLEMGSTWLVSIGGLASKARGGHALAVVESKAIKAKNYSYKRSNGESVSGAKLYSESHPDYIQALRNEVKAEESWHSLKYFHEDILEAVNSLKISMRYDMSEQKYIGRER